MFYFQYIIQTVKLSFIEMSPEIRIRFGEMTNKLELPNLKPGINQIGLGKQLTVNITTDELQNWFNQYAFCLQFSGDMLNGRLLTTVCSLSKLELTDQITDFPICFKDPQDINNRIDLIITLKFRHIHNQIFVVPKVQFVQQKSQIKNTKLSSTLKTAANKKSGSFLYGNSSASKITQKKRNIKPHSTQKRANISKQIKSKNAIAKSHHNSEVSNQNINTNFEPYPQYFIPHFQPTTCYDMFNQQYFCPPAMEFTNDAIEITIPKKIKFQKQPVKIENPKNEMDNYSFQGNFVTKQKKVIQKNKVLNAIQKKKIKQLVEQQFINNPAHVVVPVKAPDGGIVFKKLQDIKETDLQNLVSKKRTSIEPIVNKPIKKTISQITPKPHQTSHVSQQYPQDFQSMSLGHQSMMNKQFGSISKIRKTQQIVHEQSISEIAYSDNFESYSISRSNIKKSFDDVSESIRSASHSFRR